MRHRKPLRYRVLWRDLGGDNYACDRADLRAAWREARALDKEAAAWQDIRIHDTKDGVIWTLTRGAR